MGGGFCTVGVEETAFSGRNRDSTPEKESPSAQSFDKIISISDYYKWRHLHFCSPHMTMCLHERRTRQDTLDRNVWIKWLDETSKIGDLTNSYQNLLHKADIFQPFLSHTLRQNHE